MKRFIFSILTVSVFFLGIGALVERTGAKFKSDEKALALVAKARLALGGDAAINNVQSLRILGRTSQKVNLNGVESLQDGETEIAMQFPDKLMKMVKIGKDDGTGESRQIINHQVDIITTDGNVQRPMKIIVNGQGHGEGAEAGAQKKIVINKDGNVQELTGADADKWIAEHPDVPGEKHIIIKKADGSVEEIGGTAGDKVMLRRVENDDNGNATFTSKDGKTFDIVMDHKGMAERHEGMRQNEMLRLTLSLLLTSPKGIDVEYTYGGEGDIDGTRCSIVVASFGGQSYKIFLDNSSNLPVAMAYKGFAMPKMMTFTAKVPAPGELKSSDAIVTRSVEAPADGDKRVMVFTTKPDGGEAGKNVMFKRINDQVDYLIKFSDYRSTGGVQLPYRWTQTGGSDETFDVTSYEINPANIAEKFQNQKIMVRTKKPDGQ